MTTPHVVTAHADSVLTIELLRREKMNAITRAMYDAMSDALENARDDAGVRTVLLRGQADLFTAGNDVADFMSANVSDGGQGHRFLVTISSFPKPIVAAVGGVAVGIGTTMLLHCDLVVASEQARFQLPFVNLGLCPEAGASMLLPQMAGPRLAAELLLLGDFFDAPTAVRAGIVNQIVPPNGVIEHAESLAKRLARQPREALAITKALLKRPLGRDVREAIEEEYPHFVRLLGSDEARAIFSAFLNKK